MTRGRLSCQVPNPSVNRTARKQRLRVPFALRAPVTGDVPRFSVALGFRVRAQ
jgi:hypothetical protein